jgi:hypothetical protein
MKKNQDRSIYFSEDEVQYKDDQTDIDVVVIHKK